ncbi:hypothetical protein M0R04_12945 [Candidatus Dojkabacteria bacterium]|jgi:hypothetical protein|nr:hypothetical protein [Candidatus Dojkabacteria bacterium]
MDNIFGTNLTQTDIMELTVYEYIKKEAYEKAGLTYLGNDQYLGTDSQWKEAEKLLEDYLTNNDL